MSFGDIFLTETLGTAILLLLGAGVVANVILPSTKGNNGGWLLINFGWGLAVFAGVFVAGKTGAHLNPAVTFGIWAKSLVADGVTFGPEIEVTTSNLLAYLAGEFLGAMIGAVLAYLAYKQHFDQKADAGIKLAVFSTGPALRSRTWNVITEAIATFVLVFVIFNFGTSPNQLGPLAVAMLVVGIGASLGGPTGYAINPARDLGPRIVHAILPIPGKGSSDWGYAWVPVVGPLIGGIAAGLLAGVLS